MATAEILHHALNVGVVDPKNLHRIDLAKMRLAAEDQTNLMALATGTAFLRPGTEKLCETQSDNTARPIPFVAGEDASYALELTANTLRIFDDEAGALVTRASVSTTVTSGTFSSSSGWTLASTSGQTTAITGGQLEMTARARGAEATCKQTLTISSTDYNTVHALAITVTRGPVTFRLGKTADDDDLIQETTLDTGYHSLAFDPDGSTVAYLRFSSRAQYKVIVDSCQIESAGVLALTTPWDEDHLPYIQTAQSLDVMYVACNGVRQQKIERRGSGDAEGLSWSVCDYHADDGPFYAGRTANVKLKPSATESDITLTADAPFFKSTHVGALFKLWHTGQRIDTYLAGDSEYTPTFMVTGITETNFEERKYAYTISGTWTGTIRNYRSFDGDDVEFHQYRREQASATIDITANASYTNDDNDDNAITWVKFGFEDSSYTSGEAHIVSIYNAGGGYGICRITAVASNLSASAQVLTPFLGNVYTDEWQEGQWSSRSGFPTGVGFFGGRLMWAGSDNFWGSISDAYTSFDEEFDGDAAPINRAIALSGRNEARWILSTDACIIGCNTRVAQARASSLDELLTAANVNIRNIDKVPCSHITPVELKNDRSLFVAGSRTHIYEINYSNDQGDYLCTKFSLLTDSLFAPGVRQMAVTTFPDQRVWCVMEDGTACMVLYEPLMDIVCAIPIRLRDGDSFEGVCVLPGLEQDRVYFSTSRSINGSTKRFLEKLALDSEALPDDITKCMDCHVVFGTNGGSTTLTGLDHLEGETVVVWQDGDAVNEPGTTTTQEFQVSSGQITLLSAPTIGGCVGLPYRGRYKSARLAYGPEGSSPFFKWKNINTVGFILADYCRSGVQFGGLFDDDNHPLMNLPELISTGTAPEVVQGVVEDDQVNPVTTSPVGPDPRLCIELNAPKPASILSIVMGVGV